MQRNLTATQDGAEEENRRKGNRKEGVKKTQDFMKTWNKREWTGKERRTEEELGDGKVEY